MPCRLRAWLPKADGWCRHQQSGLMRGSQVFHAPAQTCLPIWNPNIERILKLGAGKNRIGRPSRRSRIFGRRHWKDRNPTREPQLGSQSHDGLCKAMPSRCAASAEMVNPELSARSASELQQNCDSDLCNHAAPIRDTVLIIDYAQRRIAVGESQHCQQKIRTTCSVYPAGTEYQGAAVGRFDCRLAHALGAPIGAEWMHHITLNVSVRFLTVEHVIRRVVDEQGAQRPGFSGQDFNRSAIHRQRGSFVLFRSIDGSVGRCVDDRIGTGGTYNRSDLRRMRQVNLATARGHHVEMRRKDALKFPTHLTIPTEQQNSIHGNASAFISNFPCRSFDETTGCAGSRGSGQSIAICGSFQTITRLLAGEW